MYICHVHKKHTQFFVMKIHTCTVYYLCHLFHSQLLRSKTDLPDLVGSKLEMITHFMTFLELELLSVLRLRNDR